MQKIRLDKILATRGYGSRKEVKHIIKSGRVQLNNTVVSDASILIDSDNDILSVDGHGINLKEFVYLMLNKPSGVVSATKDNMHETVLDIIPKQYYRTGLAPAGRLDIDTTGFVVLTNDGDFMHKIISPASEIPKTYVATVGKALTQDLKEKFSRGITLKDGYRCKPATIEIISTFSAKITIYEGKYHQIKRMFAAVNFKVTELRRIKIGGCLLDDSLGMGECRELHNEEITQLVQN